MTRRLRVVRPEARFAMPCADPAPEEPSKWRCEPGVGGLAAWGSWVGNIWYIPLAECEAKFEGEGSVFVHEVGSNWCQMRTGYRPTGSGPGLPPAGVVQPVDTKYETCSF